MTHDMTTYKRKLKVFFRKNNNKKGKCLTKGAFGKPHKMWGGWEWDVSKWRIIIMFSKGASEMQLTNFLAIDDSMSRPS